MIESEELKMTIVLVQTICDTSLLIDFSCHCETQSAEAISEVVVGWTYKMEIAVPSACHCPTRSGNPEIGSVCFLDHPVKDG
jgi:hypothetical protein